MPDAGEPEVSDTQAEVRCKNKADSRGRKRNVGEAPLRIQPTRGVSLEKEGGTVTVKKKKQTGRQQNDQEQDVDQAEGSVIAKTRKRKGREQKDQDEEADQAEATGSRKKRRVLKNQTERANLGDQQKGDSLEDDADIQEERVGVGKKQGKRDKRKKKDS